MLKLQPNERITLELMAKKTVYCERNTVISLFFIDNHDYDKNHDNHDHWPGVDSEEGGQGGGHRTLQDQTHL